jgi:hypothetical protein
MPRSLLKCVPHILLPAIEMNSRTFALQLLKIEFSRLLLASTLVIYSSLAISQNAAVEAGKIFEIGRTDTAPRIDGDLSDPAWANAARRDDFLELTPVEHRAASERTEFSVMYDENALYIGIYVYDSKPDEITANTIAPDGSLRWEDKIVLTLDPNNSQRGGYLFQLNSNGVRNEALYITGSQLAYDWEAIWRGNARRVEDGWTAEMEIPFKSLSFDPDNDTWGFNLSRDLQRNVSELAWYSLNGEASVANAGKMTGITGISQGVGLDVVPAISGIANEDRVTGNEESEIQPSVDIFYKITPQINLAVTVNTDFSATEADSNTLNSTRFVRFFEEKRAFFLNDFDAFNFGLANMQLNGRRSGNNALAFYSRRIGLSDNGTPVDIAGGIKLSGQAGNTEFGALVMRQSEFLAEGADPADLINPTNAIVARVSQSILTESKIGLLFTDGNPAENQNNSLYGIDFHYRDSDFYANKALQAILVYQQTEDPDFDDNQSSYTATVSFSGNSGWQGGGQYFVVEENYSPGLGFTQRTNAELFSGALSHTWVFENSELFQEFEMGFDTERWNDFDTGNLDSSEFSLNLSTLTFVRGDQIGLELYQEKEYVSAGGRNPTGELGFNVPEGTYTQNRFEFGYSTPSFWDISGGLELDHGDYFTGTSTEVAPSVEWQANRHVAISAEYALTKFELPGDTVYTREVNLDLSISFNSSMSLTSQIEYDNVRREASFNNRFRWQIEPGQDLWIVYNQGMIDEDEDYRFAVEDTVAAFKFVYTLRF